MLTDDDSLDGHGDLWFAARRDSQARGNLIAVRKDATANCYKCEAQVAERSCMMGEIMNSAGEIDLHDF